MPNYRRIGIIDIGSNSIRLVIYEINPLDAYRVIREFKQSARLSQRIGPDNILHAVDIQVIIGILNQFKRMCEDNGVTEIRAAATAAIRNAANTRHIIESLQQHTGIRVEVLSGEDEAKVGFLGMLNSLDVQDGILIDIGGGSTEVTVFRGRERLKSVSFPFGAVNTARRYSSSGDFTPEQLQSIREMVLQAVDGQPWMKQHQGLPLIGMGGTIRTLGKIGQKKWEYSLPITHNYVISPSRMDELIRWLAALPLAKRKKVDGLAKDRCDIIVPGMVILDTLFHVTGCSHYVVSGAGLRDGLFHESYLANRPEATTLLERSVNNLLGLHSTAPAAHLESVARHALALFDALRAVHGYDDRMRQCLCAAARLYRIGVAVNYYQFSKHSYYMIAHSRVDGLSHRETLLCAAIASFKSKNRAQSVYAQHKDILHDSDVALITKLGVLLQLATALDISETQTVTGVTASAQPTHLDIRIQTKNDLSPELAELESLQKEFNKIWGLQLHIHSS
ncbi:Ppx/GppA phosphatase family protein [Paenibacillus xerothermodurans]|uniref:Ppx/GppA family phosphatase n=1 Tax=Paenibacillus xerothermodurans TaxID=1977292 RepID=A0A2W1NRG5_PAEXE|nr:Ppx/GppA phosphatase family protein [Paenibacillus xerothermodurans]PZE21473.1 Ppx/GppA family phosphatase [Paenibacillus xerothermodurans]